MAVSIQTFADTDLEISDSILQSAFQRSESWRSDLQLFRQLQPDGIFLAHQQGIPAGMVAAILYSRCAYVGLMGVRQEFQKQGAGSTLMRHLLAWLDQQGVQQVLLDASPMGQPLYEKFDFVAGNYVYVLQRRNDLPTLQRPIEARFITPQDLDLVTAIDAQVFGADRSKLLQALIKIYPERAFVIRGDYGRIGGYLIAQEKRIGPWVMEDPEKGELLLRAALSLPFRVPVSAVVPGENPEAIALLQRHRFETRRVNRHMMRGLIEPAGRREKVYTQASLSLG